MLFTIFSHPLIRLKRAASNEPALRLAKGPKAAKNQKSAPVGNSPKISAPRTVPATPPRRSAIPDPLTPTQSKLPANVHGLMFPRNRVLKHPAARTLLKWAIEGCPLDCGKPWTHRRIQAAIDKAAHPSAQSHAAATACRNEALERVTDKCVRLIKWDDIKHNPPKNLKISPIAAIPHKSRAFQMILDLSFNITINGEKLPSVNETSDKSLAPQHAMYKLGNVIPRLVWTLATSDSSLPFLFTKVDLKDGYWRMCVNAKDAWNFAYVLPKLSDSEPTRLVIPDALQMGWSESPPFFCAATETARDVAIATVQATEQLPSHPLESIMMNSPAIRNLPKHCSNSQFIRLLEVYIDDFIGIIQARSVEDLRRFTRAILHAIYEVFPPPELTGSIMGPPVSEKNSPRKVCGKLEKKSLDGRSTAFNALSN